ncbi:hypothetical protein Droror1_Dr00014751 [Drosera rotundifolia]
MESVDCAVVEPNSAGVGEKRAAEEREGDMRRKRRRKVSEGEMRRVAEIVMVLSAMGRMRGGKEPTEVERRMMVEAREKAVGLLLGVRPRDVVSREGVSGLIEDLGIGRGGIQAPRLSVAERMEVANRRMAEAKARAAQTASHPTQRVQTATAAVANHRGPVTNFHVFPSNKQGPIPVPIATVPAGHASPMISATMAFPTRSHEIRPSILSPGLANSSAGREFPSTAPSRVKTIPHKQDARPNGPFFTPQVPAEQHLVKYMAAPLQAVAAPLAHDETRTRAMDHALHKGDQSRNISSLHMAPQAKNVQAAKPVVAQTVSSVSPGVHHPVQGAQFVQTASIFSRHADISKVVQKLLHPNLPEQRSWTIPSRDYMNRAVACQLCKNAMNEVDGVLVCDACEKAYHIRCLQSLNKKVVPRGEWHCHRCLSISNGKPIPPKYGRVTRNSNPPSGPSDTSAGQSSSGKKVENADQDLSPPNVMSGSLGNQNSFYAGTIAGSFSVAKLPDGSVTPLSVKDAKQHSERRSSDAIAETTFASLPVGPSADKPTTPVVKSEPVTNSESLANEAAGAKKTASASLSNVPPSDKPPAIKSESLPHVNTRVASAESDVFVKTPPPTSTSDKLQGSRNDNTVEHQGVSEGVEVLREEKQDNGDGSNRPSQKFDAIETDDSTSSHIQNVNNQNAPQDIHDGTVEVRGQSELSQHSEDMQLDPQLDSEDKLLGVDWVGDIQRIADKKKFYQSCSIGEVVYEVEDYALFQLGNGKLVPSKLQAMWEDSKTSAKRVAVNRCYFPVDLPDSVGRPCAPESNEVYESNHEMTLMAGSIRGPCEVNSPYGFGENNSKSKHGSQLKAGERPVFICKWFYDKIKGVFRPIPS